MVIEVCREYRLPLVLTFVDYEKAFDSVETNAILSALVDQGVDSSYIRTLADCYHRCSTTIQLFRRAINIPIEKGWVMKSLNWDEKGIRVDGKFLSNLRERHRYFREKYNWRRDDAPRARRSWKEDWTAHQSEEDMVLGLDADTRPRVSASSPSTEDTVHEELLV
ncbi:hypothetical protein Q1695_008656 [Nippostrongylus brasiliensis]|nr:hypothetical protein Q1695_008656 [Nippostrongylus brasiliensis]